MKRSIIKIAILLIATMAILTSCRLDVWGGEYKEYGTGSGGTSSSLIFTGASPAYPSATQARYSDKVVLNWNSVIGADYYEIYKAVTPSIDTPHSSLVWKKVLVNPIQKTSYVDTDVNKDEIYVYRVRARNFALADKIGDYSTEAYGWILTPPTTFSATQGADKKIITLNWSKVENIKGYRVYWSDTGYGGTWQIAIPSGMEAYDYVMSPNATEFAFTPAKQYQGTSLYFYVESISKTNEKSEPSVQRLGYTFVEGAPLAPKNFVAGRGVSQQEITLTWDAMYGTSETGDPVSLDWEIYRSSSGESERKIYSTVDGDPTPTDDSGKMSYVDRSNLVEGVEYNYTIRAIAKITTEEGQVVSANGLPSSCSGFLFSPPTIVEKSAITTDPENGFTFTFRDAIGADENPTWMYTVYGSESKNGPWTALEGYTNIPVTDVDRKTVFSPYNDTCRYEYFTIETSDGYQISRRYDEVVGTPIAASRPVRPDGFSASDNKVISGTTDKDGFYPVSISMVKEDIVASYNLRIWKTKPASNKDEGFEQINNLKFEMIDSSKQLIRINDAKTTPIGTRYYYSVQGVDILGREGEWSDVDSGYSAITGNTLIKYMQCYAMKPWEFIDKPVLTTEYPYSYDINKKWKESSIYDKIAQAGTGSLSSPIFEASYFNNGKVGYTATLTSSLEGNIVFTFNNFGEVEWINTTGNYNMVVKMSGDGSCVGALTVKGMYPASIGFENISVKSQAFIGTYSVLQSNGTGVEQVSPAQSY